MSTEISTVGIKTNNLNGAAGALTYTRTGAVYGFQIPKTSLKSKINEKRLQLPGIYFLIGQNNDGDMSSVYVGKAGFRNSQNNVENQAILARLREHADSTSEWYQDLWDYAIAFTSSEAKENGYGSFDLISS